MRNILMVGTVLLASGCAMQPPAAPTQVSWAYGSGNGDGVSYQGTKPIYQRAYGAGNGDSVTSGATAASRFSYGADGMSGSNVMFAPPPVQTAQPVTTPKPAS